MGVITTGTNPKLLWPGLKAIWGNNYEEHEKEWTQLFDSEASEKNYEEDQQVTQFGYVPVKSQAGSTQYDSESQGYTSRYTNTTYSLGFIVAMEEMMDNLYEEVARRRTQGLAFSYRQTEETVHANIYNRAFNSSYTGGDGTELCATDHSTRSGNQSNELATAADLSEASIEDMTIQIMGAENDRGLQISLMPQSLIVPRQLFYEAHRIIDSTLQSGTANNDSNILKSQNVFPGGIIMNHYLTDADAWFIRTNAPRGLISFQRMAAEFTEDNDFDTENMKYKVVGRYVPGWTDWRGLYGSPGA